MNSSISVNTVTLNVMREELTNGHERTRAVLERGGDGWEELFAPSDFYVAHAKYLAAEIYVAGVPEHLHESLLRSWTGFAESRLRKLTDFMTYLPLERIRLMPKRLPLLTVKDALKNEGISYLVGFDVDRNRIKGNSLDLTNKMEAFKEDLYFVAGKQGLVNEEHTHEQLRIKIVTFGSWKELPDSVLTQMNGRRGAKAARKAHVQRLRLLDGSDPASLHGNALMKSGAERAASVAGLLNQGDVDAQVASSEMKRKLDDDSFPNAKEARIDHFVTPESSQEPMESPCASSVLNGRIESTCMIRTQMEGDTAQGIALAANSAATRGKIKLTLS